MERDELADEGVDETGRNPTQRRMDEEGTDPTPVDVEWEDNEPSPHEGEAGQGSDAA